MQVKKLLSLTTSIIYCSVLIQFFLLYPSSNLIFAETNQTKFSKQSEPTIAMDHDSWKSYLKDVSARTPSTERNMLLTKLFSVRLHDITYASILVEEQEQLLYELIKKIRIQQPSVLVMMDLISFHLQIKKGKWSKALKSGLKFTRSSLLRSLSLPNLEYFLYHLNRVAEMERYSLDSSLKFPTDRWLLPKQEDLRQANIAFFLFQTKFLELHHQSVIKLDSKFYDSYLNAILHVSEYGLKLSKLNPWGQLRARKNPRRRRLLHESQGLPPQLTLALLQIKKCSRFASSDFQLYNAYLQQAFLSDLAGRDNQRFNAIKAAAELHPSPRLYLELAAIYKSRKDYSKMHTYNQKAIRLDPNAIEISGPQPSVELKQQKISKDTSFSKTIASLSKRIESSQIIDKKIQDILTDITQLTNSDELTRQINRLLEQSIPLENLAIWVETWASIYKKLEISSQNRLQARFLLWLQIMLYSEQSPKQKLSPQTIKTLEIIAQDSILGASINKCLQSTSPASLHQ